jgi:hypothetical protein
MKLSATYPLLRGYIFLFILSNIKKFKIAAIFGCFFMFSGCSGLYKRPTPDELMASEKHQRDLIEWGLRKQQETYSRRPTWKRATTDEVVEIEYFDKKGAKIGSGVLKKR